MNRLFQGDDIDPFGMFEELEKLFKSFLKRISNLCCVSMKAASVTDLHFLEDADLGETFCECLQKICLCAHEKDLKRRCFTTAQLFKRNLQKRLPHAATLLKKLKAVGLQSILRPCATKLLWEFASRVFACLPYQL